MLTLTTHKKCCILLSVSLFFMIVSYAQVGIGTLSPEGGSILDISATDKGILVPRVNISDLTTIDPVTGGSPSGLLVYNTNTTTGEGFHYWDSSDWIPLIATTSGTDDDWRLSGNTGTTPGTGAGQDYIGTGDAQDVILATNDIERVRILDDGRVSVNDATPFGTDLFTSNSTTSGEFAINGFSVGTGTGVYGQNTGSGIAISGINSSTGRAVSGVNFSTGVGVYGESFFGTGFSVFGLDGPIWGDNTLFGGDAVVGNTDSGALDNGVWGINDDAGGTAILGGTSGIHVLPEEGVGVSGSSPILGLFGYAGEGRRITANRGNAGARFVLDTDSNPNTDTGFNAERASAILAGFDNVSPDGLTAVDDSYFGGYFSAGRQTGSQTFAYVGMRYNTNNGATSGTDYKVIGTGSVSTLIPDDSGNLRVMFAPEAPEILFQDYGVGQLVNGEARITIDPVLKKSLYVDDEHPLKVFISLEGDCNGVYVTSKSIDGFTVKELKNGTSTIPFSWQIVANRADRKDESGIIVSRHVGLRLPKGPSFIKPKPLKTKKLSKPDYENFKSQSRSVLATKVKE